MKSDANITFILLHGIGGNSNASLVAYHFVETQKNSIVKNSCFLCGTIYVNFNFFFTSFKAIQKGNLDGARIHAENAIRQKYQVSRLTSDGVL